MTMVTTERKTDEKEQKQTKKGKKESFLRDKQAERSA